MNLTIKPILKGSACSILISLLLLFIYAIVLINTNIQENTIKLTIFIITSCSVFLGSLIFTSNLSKNGILNGGLIGLVYIFSIYLLSSIFFSNFQLNYSLFIMFAISIFFGTIGGIIGINH